ITIWSPTAVPAGTETNDTNPNELGVKFRADAAGYIQGIRFYKSATNTGTHTGSLWSSTGTKLATATFSGETAAGWQEVRFATPAAGATGVAPTAGVTATFSEAMDATTISTGTFELRDAANTLVPASVSYDSATNTARLQPTSALGNAKSYTATVKGGSTSVK